MSIWRSSRRTCRRPYTRTALLHHFISGSKSFTTPIQRKPNCTTPPPEPPHPQISLYITPSVISCLTSQSDTFFRNRLPGLGTTTCSTLPRVFHGQSLTALNIAVLSEGMSKRANYGLISVLHDICWDGFCCLVSLRNDFRSRLATDNDLCQWYKRSRSTGWLFY